MCRRCNAHDKTSCTRRNKLDVALRDFLLEPHDPLPLLLSHLAAVNPAEVYKRAAGHDAVGQLCGRGLEAVKSDLCLPPHVRRHLEGHRGFARRRPSGEHNEVAEIAVKSPVEAAEAVLDEFPLF